MVVSTLVIILVIILVAWLVVFIFARMPSPKVPSWFAQVVWVVAAIAVVVLLIRLLLNITGTSLP